MTKAINLEDFTKEEVKEILSQIRHPIDIAVFDSSNYFNLGAIIRTAHSFLVGNIYAVDLPDYYPKATMGTRKWETIIKLSSDEFFKIVSGRNIVAMERRPNLETESLYTFSWPDNPVVLFGGEKTGLSDETLSKCNHVVSVPIYGINRDLNVSVIAGTVLYDWANKFYSKK